MDVPVADTSAIQRLIDGAVVQLRETIEISRNAVIRRSKIIPQLRGNEPRSGHRRSRGHGSFVTPRITITVAIMVALVSVWTPRCICSCCCGGSSQVFIAINVDEPSPRRSRSTGTGWSRYRLRGQGAPTGVRAWVKRCRGRSRSSSG